MKTLNTGYISTSAAFTIKTKLVKYYSPIDKKPVVGDVVYGSVKRIGQHSSLENVSGRIHTIHHGTRGLFVFGNRYAPDYYEGLVPDEMKYDVDLLARSGLIGTVKTKSSAVKDPTRIKILGYLVDREGRVLNTRDHPLIAPKSTEKKTPRASMILVCGTSMNSGKSMAAAACCWALTAMGHAVKASKVTGTASLKDILHMNDAGAIGYADFTYLGYPSTYMLSEEEVLGVFKRLDLKYANKSKNYWIVEFADGINQRETAMLLASETVTSRIHRLVLCANDAFGTIGGLRVLRERFGLVPDALSGVCSSSPLHVRELSVFTTIPIFNSARPDLNQLAEILIPPKVPKSSRLKSAA